MSRGLSNNNPGNIVLDGRQWLGEVLPSKDKRFKQFRSRAYGYRAIFVNLAAYIRNGHNTIEKIITRWAPAFENNTASYIAHVAAMTGIPKNQVISTSDHVALIEITKAISKIENGVPAIDVEVLDGFNLWRAGQMAALKKK